MPGTLATRLNRQSAKGHQKHMNTLPFRIVIIGSQGRMGAMLAHRWQSAGYPVDGLDLPLTDDSFASTLPGAALVLLCIPAGALSEVLPRLVRHLDGTQILGDITSVKIRPMEQMEAAYTGPVVGTHPLFGPKPLDTDLRVCITPGRNAQEAQIQLVEQAFTAFGCSCFRDTPQVHDRAAASIQGLNFISTLAYFSTLSGDEGLLPYLTPSFRRRMDSAQKMLMEDGPLFEWLFQANPLSQESVRRYRSFLNVAAGGDIDVLVQRARWWWEQQPQELPCPDRSADKACH